MPDPIATIFHITDMHLFVDEAGELRAEPLKSARLMTAIAKKVPVPQLRALFSGAMWHNEEALKTLLDELPEEVAREREETSDATPVFLLQTGDVEALGSAASLGVDGHAAFPSFAFVHQQLRPASRHRCGSTSMATTTPGRGRIRR